MNIHTLPTHERPREKLIARGVESLKDYELLAVLLRTGTAGKNVIEISRQLLAKHDMPALLQLTLKDITQIRGIGNDKACTLLAAFELARRALKITDSSLPIINGPVDILAQLGNIRQHKKEHFVVFYLNARNQLIHRETISIGTVNSSIVHPREVFEPAIRCCASHLILSHNHPSGDADPSQQDIDITDRIVAVGKVMGIEIADHIIVASHTYFSFEEKGILG